MKLRNIQDWHVTPKYGAGSKLFTVKIHHGGEFIEIPRKIYMGGEFDYIDFCNAEEFSLSSFGLFAKILGYKDHLGFYYLLPKTSLRDGLVFILTEGDVQRMKDIALANGKIDIYVVETSHEDSQINKNIDENTDKHTESDQEESSYEDKSLYDTDYDQSEDDVLEVESPNGNLNKTEKNQINMNYEDEEIYVSDIDDKSSSDDLHSIHSEDEEQPPYRFNTQTDMEEPQFMVGMIFTNALEFKEAVKQHAITWQRDIKFLKNDKLRVRAKCNGNNCPWVVLASKVRNSTNFQIKTLNITHNCGRTLSKHRFVNSKLLSKKYMNDWRLHDGWKMGDFQEKVQNDLNVEVSRAQYYRTKNKVHNLLYGNYKDQYKRLYDYCEELRVSNPGSTVVLKTSMDEVAGEERFERLYICFEACKSGFLEGCRPVIGLDGCHLKGPHKGILLSTVGIDPNNSIFPLCYCVVETEDKNSWKWFLELLQQDIAIYDQDKWTFISDRQKGLMPAMYEILPEVEHRFCVRHMYTNFRKIHSGLALKDRLWNLAKASTVAKFSFQMESLKEFNEAAYEWIAEVHPRHWSRSHFRTYPKCDILLNNLCESFNSTLLEARNKPLLNMLEMIRKYLQKRLQSRREVAARWNGKLCTKVQKMLEKLKDETRSCISTYAGGSKFEVRDMYGGQYAVDIAEKSCSCRRWELSGIPCVHGVSAIVSSGREPEDYVHSCYSIESYLKAYGFIINPIKGQEEWPKTRKGPVAPNQELRLPGRPKKSRKKESNEKATSREKIMKLSKVGQKTLSCTNCKQEGHNKRKCPNTPLTASSTSSVPPFVEATPLAQVPPQRQATPLAQVEPRKKKRCSVCLKEGHYRNTCPTATGRMWQNMDFYGYNCQKNPTRVPSVARNLNAPSSIGMNEIGETEMSALVSMRSAPSMSSFTVSNPPTPSGTSISVHEPAQSLNLGGVSMKANFKKGGKNCVTLSTLEYAARSRMLKESNARDIGHLSQQSSTAK